MRGLVAYAALALALCVTGIISEPTPVSAQRRARAKRWLELRDGPLAGRGGGGGGERRDRRGSRARVEADASSTASSSTASSSTASSSTAGTGATDQWLQLLSQYAKNRASSEFPLKPFPVDLPTIGADGRTATLPLLVLPLPVPVRVNDGECNANLERYRDEQSFGRYQSALPQLDVAGGVVTSRDMVAKFRAQAPEAPHLPPAMVLDRPSSSPFTQLSTPPRAGSSSPPRTGSSSSPRAGGSQPSRAGGSPPPRAGGSPPPRAGGSPPPRAGSSSPLGAGGSPPPRAGSSSPPRAGGSPPPRAGSFSPPRARGSQPPRAGSSSPPRAGGSPPPRTGSSSPPRAGGSPPPWVGSSSPPPAARDGGSPPKPRFDRSMVLRGMLTVHRADFSEPYTTWWDAGSGAARLDLHEGATSTYRTVLPDGRMRLVEMGMDRTGERDVRRCGVSTPHTPTAADRAHPALPDTEPFTFFGYQEGSQTEVWRHTVQARAGEYGAARGESLVYRHELRVTRGTNGTAMPRLYSLSVDSSVLGPDCDGYTHEYSEARAEDHDPTMFRIDIEGLCEERQTLNMSDAVHRARLEPLREFLMPHGDTRHDAAFDRFKIEFGRIYQDDAEEAMRKNLYVRHTRFVSSSNRLSAPFELEINFLADRLDAELDVLLGVAFADDPDDALDFPYSDSHLRTIARDLPDEFDWRQHGAVSPVKYQDSCSSCWAFAVTGAVEGALFVRTHTLVELAEQCLVDCAHSSGAHGCNGTWPSHAYDYIRDEGLPARDLYPPYSNRVMRCLHPPVPAVTHISGHVNVKPEDEVALKVAIRKHAPSVIIIDAKANSFIFYKKGVLQDERCKKGSRTKLNHAILAVGWGKQRGETHFLAKNTYSAAWGEAGYVRLHARSNTCGVLTLPSYPELRAPDPDRADLRAAAAAAFAAPSSEGDDDR